MTFRKLINASQIRNQMLVEIYLPIASQRISTQTGVNNVSNHTVYVKKSFGLYSYFRSFETVQSYVKLILFPIYPLIIRKEYLIQINFTQSD